MNLSDLILGVDAGGSKTVAWLATRDAVADAGVIGCGLAGPANPQAVGFDTALRNLDQSIARAFADAELGRGSVASACIGLAGAGRELDQQAVQQWAEDAGLAERVTVTHDAMLVLAAGTPDGRGVALISGTGSLAFGRNAAGETARCGGWGPLLGDEGSGYAIALAGLRAAAQAADGRGAATSMLDSFLKQLDLRDASELIPTIHAPHLTRSDIARLALVVFAASNQHDAPALGIVRAAAAHLAQMVATVASQLGFDQRPFPMALAGGVLLHQPPFRQQLCETLAAAGLDCDPTTTVADPVAGALALAGRA